MASVTLTDEQFQQLLNRLTVSQAPVAQRDAAVNIGNLAKCSSRFDGSKDNDVNAFITAVEIYKDCTQVSNENALKGLPMLFDGFAASWFQGVKSTLKTWDEAVDLLRTTFGPRKPPFRVYRELFAEEQSANTNTDIFVCKCRAVLAQLPSGTLQEETQLDMVYGLLNVKIRKNIPRDKVQTFNDLLTEARIIEETFVEEEDNLVTDKPRDNEKSNKKPRCAFCKNLGHGKEQCHKLAASRAKTSEGNAQKSAALSGANSHNVATPALSSSANSSIPACYGCGLPGYVRSNCPKCKVTTASAVDFSSADFEHIAVTESKEVEAAKLSPRARPVLNIGILGFKGIGLVDTAAKQSIAGHMLHKIFQDTGQPLIHDNITMKLADGSIRNRDILLAHVNVFLEGRVIPTTFVVLPNAKNNTLLGIDFITNAKIDLNIPNETWNFVDEAEVIQKLHFEELTPRIEVNASSFEILRPEEGQMLTTEQRAQVESLLAGNGDIFSLGGEATPYAEHFINTGDHPPIAVPPYRMSPAKKEQLRSEIEKLLEGKIIEEAESAWASPVVLVPKKGGGIRLCVDYRKLNAITVTDSYPLPRIDDLIHAAKRSMYMSTMDLRAGYHQISVNERDRDKTAFTTPFGTFRYLRMPFGLKNAPASFQRLIDFLKRGLSDVLAVAYLDDLLVISSTLNGHIADLQKVFDRGRPPKKNDCVVPSRDVSGPRGGDCNEPEIDRRPGRTSRGRLVF